MSFVPSPRLLLPLGLLLLTACAQQKTGPVVLQDQQDDCPLSLSQGQPLVLTLPSNPTTGFRWVVRDAAANVLQSLGPEVYSTPEDAGLVGSAGQSTWRFKASQPGEGRLRLDYQRPWETDVAPAESFDCQISVK
ncbi:protease inhibitor I42 family protein [Pseudomonas sp. JS3066]|jgi:inhibitor of cysteine peptidase|uniref:protease inhibitor I42 family protein n=1 Tax=unclassified Pseudomonas TaxID=196821 RepID=UPI000EA8988F|nr:MULTISPECIES: protease inhibitor I42 family protein [unclassified Pseudomonas]AYF87904.1 peptidase inhibitor I42 [Pseudomonas sp. DY-1]MDH4655690.1 peptidase inhibitor I42 [Pseudomonas sp. BN606]MRK19133.1 protease inhibitor I42 family protein [Pseudomonas sp. JG-B]WVK94528.1 protease inhibitor I42 family protein [Pseudomonas sp. JS3066]